MTKYIVKNCPAYGVTTPTSCALTSDDSCEFTDCPIKQVVDKCKAECEAAERQLDGISKEVLHQFPQLYFLRGCRNVAYQILHMFQVEKVDI